LDPRFEVDLAVTRLSYLSSWVTPGELKAAIEEVRAALGGRLVSGDAAVPPVPQPQGPVQTVNTIEELRAGAVDALAARDMPLSAALGQTKDWALSGDEVTLASDSAFVIQQLEEAGERIAACLSNLWGKPLKFKLRRCDKPEAEETTLPPQVEILKQTFKGAVEEE
ncbi:MAG: hypothetical protein LBR23_01955, partial [Spirochaetaceae bacterium]|nr:hypothetical protein [Spirochaetaceae bacterium]